MSDPSFSNRDFERVDVFISHTGKVHYSAKHSWGMGAACTDRYLIGTATTEVRSQVDCGRCTASENP